MRHRKVGEGDVSMIVGVHGIRCLRYLARAGSPELAARALADEWASALGASYSSQVFEAAYYAHLLDLGTSQGEDDPELLSRPGQEMLMDWVSALGAPAEVTMGRTTLPVRQISATWCRSSANACLCCRIEKPSA